MMMFLDAQDDRAHVETAEERAGRFPLDLETIATNSTTH